MLDLDLVTDGWWEWDLENPSYEYMSPKFWTTLGYVPEDMPHSPDAWKDIIHEGDLKRATAAFEPHVQEDKPYHLLVRYKHAQGHWVWIICRGQVVKNEAGKPIKMYGAHTDVSAVVNSRLPVNTTRISQASEAALRSMERILGVLEDAS